MFTRLVLSLSAAVLFGLVPMPLAGQADRQDTTASDPFLKGKPFTYDQLLQAVGPVPRRRLLNAISRRKVDFQPTDVQVEALKKAGATAPVLEAIRGNAVSSQRPSQAVVSAPVAPVTPAGKNATLIARCQPAECSVFIDGKPLGFTSGGSLALAELAPRSLVVSFRKEGFVTQDFPETLLPGGRVVRSVKLLADDKFRSEQGLRIFLSMVQALGGEPGVGAASATIAKGDATIFARDGQMSQWSATIRYLAPDAVSFNLKGAGKELQSSISAKGYKANKELGKSPLAAEVDTNLRLYRDYQLPTLINRIRKEHFQIAASDGGRGFTASNATDSYTFSLNGRLEPETVKYTSTSGFGSGMQVLFANFSKEGQANAPRQITIKIPDARQHGMEMRISSLQTSAKVSEKDFR